MKIRPYALIGCLCISPTLVQGQFMYYTNADGGITITRYLNSTGPGVGVIIPSSTNGLPVTAIGPGAFTGTVVASVTVPSTVTNIGNYAFGPVPDGCFETALLGAITVDPLNPAYCSTNGVLFNKDKTVLIQYPQSKAGGSYTVPSGVTNIADFAFYSCQLTSITLPSTLVTIGTISDNDNGGACVPRGVFSGSRLGSSIIIPDSVRTIGNFAFYNCQNLSNFVIGKGVTSIGNGALNSVGRVWDGQNHPSASSVYFTGNAPADANVFMDVRYVSNVGTWAEVCYSTVYYLAGTTGWGPTFPTNQAQEFGGKFNQMPTVCSNPTWITNQDGAFGYITNLDGTVSITGYKGPQNQPADIALPNTINGLPVTRIGSAAFLNCGLLISLTIPDNVTSIGRAFYECPYLTHIVIGTNVNNISSSAFATPFHDPWTTLNVVFNGNAPTNIANDAFMRYDSAGANVNATVFYLPGTTGWGPTLAGIRTVCLTGIWISNFHLTHGGVTPETFSNFEAIYSRDITAVVDGCTNLANPVWLPATNLYDHWSYGIVTFIFTNGHALFTEHLGQNWNWQSNYPARFYRARQVLP